MQGGDLPQEDLTKFGYKGYKKVEKSETPSLFPLPTRTCFRNLVIKKKVGENLANVCHFYHGKYFALVEVKNFRLKFGKICPQKIRGAHPPHLKSKVGLFRFP